MSTLFLARQQMLIKKRKQTLCAQREKHGTLRKPTVWVHGLWDSSVCVCVCLGVFLCTFRPSVSSAVWALWLLDLLLCVGQAFKVMSTYIELSSVWSEQSAFSAFPLHFQHHASVSEEAFPGVQLLLDPPQNHVKLRNCRAEHFMLQWHTFTNARTFYKLSFPFSKQLLWVWCHF